jgi:phytoene dehydrogenase-like protein
MAAQTDIIIIGAGIAGLATGCYAQMNGYQTRIFELQDQPGGLCTAWPRQGYLIDSCIHHIFGSGPGQPFHNVWEELGTVQKLNYINHTDVMEIRGPAGEILTVHSQPDQLEEHLKSLGPEDAKLIEKLLPGGAYLQRL